MSSTGLYEVLNVPNDADVASIEKAFKQLSLKLHPDKANISTMPPGSNETTKEKEAREKRNHERFVKLAEARDILTNPTKRRDYDYQSQRAKKSSTTKARDFRNPSDGANKSERGDPPPSTTRQNTAAEPDNQSHTVIRLQECVDALNRTLSEFCRLVPSESSSLLYPAYTEIHSFFYRIISRAIRLIKLVKEARDRFYNEGQQEFLGKAYDAAKSEGYTFIRDIRWIVPRLSRLLEA